MQTAIDTIQEQIYKNQGILLDLEERKEKTLTELISIQGNIKSIRHVTNQLQVDVKQLIEQRYKQQPQGADYGASIARGMGDTDASNLQKVQEKQRNA